MVKKQIIILADQDEDAALRLQSHLNLNGYSLTRLVKNGPELIKLIRAYQHTREKLGAVILDEGLPDFDFQLNGLPFTLEAHGLFLPFIILIETKGEYTNAHISNWNNLVHFLPKNDRHTRLELLLELLSNIQQECQLRLQQKKALQLELSERKVVDAKLSYLASHDELTGFLNRNTLEKHIKQVLDKKGLGALLFIDIDRFSLINEIEGFATGDYFIVKIAGLIRKHARINCKFARIGADEFCVFLENQSETRALKIGEEIRMAVDNYHFKTSTVNYSTTISVGVVALSSANMLQHAGELVSMAHQACQVAKTNGRNTVYVYKKDEELIKERHKDALWAPIIKEALEHNCFCLHYQPIVDLNNGQVTHYEVLLRLQNKQGEIILPEEFIPAAERLGMIHKIDLYVVNKALHYLATLSAQQESISFSINLSSIAFQNDALLTSIKTLLQQTKVDPARLTFEITETTAVENFNQTRKMIDKIHQLGCGFALDDFGAGFSSFNYLKEFPVEFIKIDGQFIRNVAEDETDQILVRSMCEIARKLGRKTIAEYVESETAVSILREIGVDYGQGFLFGKPNAKLIVADDQAI